MIPAELLGLDYHPPQASPLPDYLLGRSRLETSREQGAAQQEELGRHNRAEEEIGRRGLDIRELHEKLSSAVNERKLAHKLDAERTKLWHQLNLARIDAVAKGDTVKAAQLSATLDALESEGEQSGPEAAPPEAVPPAAAPEAPPEHFEPLSPFNYSFGPGGARVGTPPPAPEAPPDVPSSVTPQQNVTEPPGPPIAAAPEEPVDTQALGRRLAAEAFGPKKQQIELPEQRIDAALPQKRQQIELPDQTITASLPKPLDPFDPLAVPIEQGTYTREANDKTPTPQAGPEEARAAEGRTRNVPGGGRMREPAQAVNPAVASVAEMFRKRAESSEGVEKEAYEDAADHAAASQTPEKAMVAGDRAYKNKMAQLRKVYPKGSGGGGQAQPTTKQMHADYEEILHTVNAVKAQHGIAADVKGYNSANYALNLIREGERTGFGDTAATAAIVKSFNGANSSDKELGRFLGAAGKLEQAQNLINEWTNGNLKTDEYVRQMGQMLSKAVVEYHRQMSAAADEAEGLIRYRHRNDPDGGEDAAAAIRQAFEGGVWKPSEKKEPKGEAPKGKAPPKEKSGKESPRERARRLLGMPQ